MRHRQTVLLRFTHSVLAHCTSWEKCGILQSTLWRSRTRTVSEQRSSTSRKGGLSPLKHCLSCSGGAAGPRPSAVAMFDANIRRAASARQWGITTRPAGAGWDSPGALLDGCPVDLPEVADSDHQLVLRLQTNEHVLAYSRSRDYPQGVAAVGRDLPRSVQALTSGSCQIPRDPKRSHGDNIEHGGNVEQTRRERDASEMPGIRRCQTQTQTHRVSGRVPGRERECQAEEREREARAYSCSRDYQQRLQLQGSRERPAAPGVLGGEEMRVRHVVDDRPVQLLQLHGGGGGRRAGAVL